MLPLHFGLGKAEQVNRIEIRWPSGLVDKISGPPVDTYVKVAEGKGVMEKR